MKALTSVLFSFLLLSVSAAYAQETNIISVTGTGTAKMEVDLAFINGAVVTQAKVVADAQAANAETFNAARDQLIAKFHLGEKDFVSTGYSIDRVYTYPPNEQPVLVGYSVRHSFQVRASKISDLGAMIDDLGLHGVDLVESITFSATDKKKYELAALAAAMQDAQANADVIARSAGRSIKQVVRVNYHPAAVPGDTVTREAAKDVEIVPGDLEVVVSVTVDYQFN